MIFLNATDGRGGGGAARHWQHPRRLLPVALLIAAVTASAQTPSQTPSRTPPVSREPGSAQTLSGQRPDTASGADQATTLTQTPERSSSQFLDPSGLTVERLVEAGFSRRADLLAARQRLAIAQGRLVQAGLRPNPELEAEYGSARFLGGEPESELDIGVSQVFETGGKRGKRVAVARLDLERTRAEVLALERQFAAEIRSSYARAIAAGRQLDALEQLIAINEELVRITNARLQEGDVSPLELNLVRVETDRLRAQVVRMRAELEGEIISLRALAGFETTEVLRLAPLPDRPPRLDLNVAERTSRFASGLTSKPRVWAKSWGRRAFASLKHKGRRTWPERYVTSAKGVSLTSRKNLESHR